MSESLDGRIGEAWSGDVPDGSHINLVVAERGSATAAAIVGALANPRPGYVPFLACLSPGMLVRPITVVINKSSVEGGTIGPITWGAAQLGIGQGILDAVADGVVERSRVDSLVLLVAVWVDPLATDQTAVKLANRRAARAALADALASHSAADLEALLNGRERAANMYYTGR